MVSPTKSRKSRKVPTRHVSPLFLASRCAFNTTTCTGVFGAAVLPNGTAVGGGNLAVELYDQRDADPFDFNKDGNTVNVARNQA